MIFLRKGQNAEHQFSRLMDEYTGFVYSIVYKRLRSVATAEDVEETVSDVFVKLYKCLGAYDRGKSSMKSYIGVIAKNTATDKYRQLAGNVGMRGSLDELPEFADEDAEVTGGLIKKEEHEAVFKAVISLKEPNRTIVFRRYYLGETDVQIAKRLGYTPNAVQKRLARSLNKLKIMLGGYFDGKDG